MREVIGMEGLLDESDTTRRTASQNRNGRIYCIYVVL